MEGIGGHSTHGRALGDWHHTLVRSARAFGPGGRWTWRVLVVPSSCCCGHILSRLSLGGGAQVLGIGQLASRACAQCLGGPFDPVDREGDGVQLVALDHHHVVAASCGCGHWWVAAQSFHAISIVRFCTMLGFPWMQGVSRQGRMPHEHGGGWRTFTLLHRCWTVN